VHSVYISSERFFIVQWQLECQKRLPLQFNSNCSLFWHWWHPLCARLYTHYTSWHVPSCPVYAYCMVRTTWGWFGWEPSVYIIGSITTETTDCSTGGQIPPQHLSNHSFPMPSARAPYRFQNHVGSEVERMWPNPFPGRMLWKQSSVFYVILCFFWVCLLCTRATLTSICFASITLLCILSFSCSGFVVSTCQMIC